MSERSLKAENAKLRKEIQLLRSRIAVLEKEKRSRTKEQPEDPAPSTYTGTAEPGWSQDKQQKLENSDPVYAHFMQQQKRRTWLD
jgi:hypothetical protein